MVLVLSDAHMWYISPTVLIRIQWFVKLTLPAMTAIDAPGATSSSADCRPCDSRPSLLQDDDDIATVVPLQS